LFNFVEQTIDSPAILLRYHRTPWDDPFFLGNTASISAITVRCQNGAAREFAHFQTWCEDNDVRLVSCRLPHEQLVESGFLEAHGFRFIELNYRPVRGGLGAFAADPEIIVESTTSGDEATIIAIASRAFTTGRMHLDPRIGPTVGDRRYAVWAANAFRNPKQSVLTMRMAERIIGFLVVEKPAPDRRFWSLISLAPGLVGQGLGRRAWRTLLAFHATEGVTEVSTSISSHNIAVFNLYVSLGFRFPPPDTTLHWCPTGPLASPGC
jgi:ribosomal protein S18 acetylase RimI-like enzyme